MKGRIFRSFCILSSLAVILTSVFISFLLYNDSVQNLKSSLKLEAEYLQSGWKSGGTEFFQTFPASVLEENQSRITLIAKDGTVLFDTASEDLENHLDRPEVQSAFETGIGESTRMSSPLSTQTCYYAIQISPEEVLRVSRTMSSVWAFFLGTLPIILGIVAAAVVISILFSIWLTQRIVKPINEIDLELPKADKVYPELHPLIHRLERQNHTIQLQMEEIKKNQADFETITSNMQEGLLILDAEGKVLSYNQSALHILQDQSYRELEEINHGIIHAQQGERWEDSVSLNGRNYTLISSPVQTRDSVDGVVVLLLDVTEQYSREALRREFSANVSHELRTPLNVISGYAEMMQAGLVKGEDVPKISSKLYQEAQRLICLIEDIIKLSQLDESDSGLEKKECDLLELARDVLDKLGDKAKEKHLSIQLNGEPTPFFGVEQILKEILWNLCDNAIKYNRENGAVRVRVYSQKGCPTVFVQDSGIGIPLEQQDRIFERFYRVDKSRSRAIGGTGLGLSIVKHGVEYHHGKLTLHSRENEGTTITIRFPEPDEKTD